MPAVTPAEPHNPDLCGSSKRHPARTPPHSTSTRPLSSHLCVLRVLCGLPSPCSPWFVFSVPSVFSVVCFFRALHVVSVVGQAFRPWPPSPTALGVRMTPAVLVDGKIVVSGKVPTVTELKQLLTGAQ